MGSKNINRHAGLRRFILSCLFLLLISPTDARLIQNNSGFPSPLKNLIDFQAPYNSDSGNFQFILSYPSIIEVEYVNSALVTHIGSIKQATVEFRKAGLGSAFFDKESLEQSIEKIVQQPISEGDFSRFKGLPLLLIMALIAFSTLISEDLTCIGAGLMAARGFIGFWPATVACFAGILIGDMLLYLAGRWLGRPALQMVPFKWMITEKDLEKSSQWFSAKGPVIIMASRFLPGSRLPTYFSAGVLGTGFWMFSLYFVAAAILWTPLLVGLSMFIGNELLHYFSIYREYALWLFLAGVLLLVFIAKFIIPAFSYKGRRLLAAKFKRFKNWEFWPPYIIYFPVCCYIAYLGLKYKSLTVFTAANPAIPDGGFIGESKADILRLFSTYGSKMPRFTYINSDLTKQEQIENAHLFIENNRLSFPVVVKPNEGQRGAGVVIATDQNQLDDTIRSVKYNLIIQEYIDGIEYGVFYYRYPDEEKGNIFSVTTKEMLKLVGDGVRTVEELILDDERAVCLAKIHFEYHENHLYKVPQKGEEIHLVELGTHARGAIFGDGKHLITDELRNEIDRISKQAGGFYFGRFDIRCRSEDSFKAGVGLNIIEVNGVSSESTNIYDESNSFFDAQKILMKQWKIAFKIGNHNESLGIPYSSIPRLIRKIATYEPK